MRSRATLTLLLFLLLLLIILAQNGALGNIFANFGQITPIYYGPTAAPLSFNPLQPTAPPSNQILPAPYVPTMYVPPTYGYGQPQVPSSGGQTVVTPPPAGVSANGSCIVPNGWVAYTIQQGDTLAIIA